MSYSIDDLTTPVTKEEAQLSIFEGLAALGVNTTNWKPGAVVRTIIFIVSILFAAASNLIADIARSAFLEYAVGSWLTFVARFVYNVERQEATFGTGTLRLTNVGGGDYTLQPGELVVRNPDTDKTYTNTLLIELGPGSELSPTIVDAQIVAQESGSKSTATIGKIRELVTAFPNVSCENTTSVVGLDAEEDPTLRQRCRDKLGARSVNGPSDAYAYVARSAKRSDGTPIAAFRLRFKKDGKGNAYIYMAGANGFVSGDPENDTTDLGVINDQIQRQVAPLGFTAHSLSATPRALNVDCQIYMLDTSGLTPAQVAALAEKALADYLARSPIGGFVIDGQPGRIYLDDLKGVIKSVRPEIFHVVFSTPAADTDMAYADAAALGTFACDVFEQQQRVA
jgi:hypothetical protein